MALEEFVKGFEEKSVFKALLFSMQESRWSLLTKSTSEVQILAYLTS